MIMSICGRTKSICCFYGREVLTDAWIMYKDRSLLLSHLIFFSLPLSLSWYMNSSYGSWSHLTFSLILPKNTSTKSLYCRWVAFFRTFIKLFLASGPLEEVTHCCECCWGNWGHLVPELYKCVFLSVDSVKQMQHLDPHMKIISSVAGYNNSTLKCCFIKIRMAHIMLLFMHEFKTNQMNCYFIVYSFYTMCSSK